MLRLADVLPAEIPMLTARAAAPYLSCALHVTAPQASLLADAGVLGTAYTGAFGCVFTRDRLDWLISRPVRRMSDLDNNPALTQYSMALVLRMRPLTEVEEYPARPFIGAHTVTERSDDPTVRAAADEAVRKYWRISPTRLQQLAEACSSGPVPLLVTVGAWVLGGRDLLDVDTEASIPGKIALNVAPVSAWFSEFTDSWLESGRGGPALWWDRR